MNQSNSSTPSADLGISINFAAVLRGEPEDLQAVALALGRALQETEGRVKLVFKHTSGNPLWITADKPKEARRDGV